jgi:peptidoglycan hydrolase-like protein with peptidoglycan-binding domain
VASEEEKKQQNDEKGFAGLSSMVSDVDATVASTPKQQQREASNSSTQQSSQATRPKRQEQPRPSQQTYQAPAQPSGGSSAGKWLFGIAAVIGVIWLVNQSDNNSPSRSTYSPAPSSTSVAPTPVWQPPAAQPQVPSRPAEEKPSVGRNNVLSTAQIRYCLAEKIRLDAAESVINNYVDSDVDRFNRYVNDYNSRCGEFRYRQGALESARRDVEPYRSQLQAEGSGRFVRSPAAATRSQTPTQTPQPVHPSPDVTVQAIQQRLNELGYDAGSADGLPGGRTRAAIMAFQRDIGIAVDGVASQALLQNALVAERRAPSAAPIQLSKPERESLESACSTDKYVNGPAAYRACLDRQTAALMAGVRRPNLSALSSADTQSIEAACSTDKYVNGPAAYNSCLNKQLVALDRQGSRPDLSRLSASDRQSIEAACSTDKYVNGPAAYNLCLSRQLATLRN